MNITHSILRDFVSFFNYTTKTGRIRLGVTCAIAICVLVFVSGGTVPEKEQRQQDLSVQTAIISSFSTDTQFQLIGTVAAVDQSVIQSEVSGRVTSVLVDLGEQVQSGQIIAKLENANQYASLLQAQGTYEAAVAAAAQSDISAIEAVTNETRERAAVVSTNQSAYTTTNTVLLTIVDDVFRNIEAHKPNFALNGGVIGEEIESLRSTLRSDMLAWSRSVNQPSEGASVMDMGTVSYAHLEKVSLLVDKIYERSLALSNVERVTLSGKDMNSYKTDLTAARAQLDAVTTSLNNAYARLKTAEEVSARADIASTNALVSSANAQLKQALGALKAAEASYNKTIFRSSISGVVNVLNVKTGDFVTATQKIAEIANNNALEITSFVGQSDRARIALGQNVTIDSVAEGVVSTIAPAVNPTTGKIEIKIESTSADLINGDTVVVTLPEVASTTQTQSSLYVPLTAVRFSATAGSVYTVENNLVVAHPVEVGEVKDVYIELLSGASLDMEIIIDARGLSEGQRVSVINK